MKKYTKILAFILCLTLIASLAGCGKKTVTPADNSNNEQTSGNQNEDNNEQKVQEMRDISTMELVREMGIGINLGNTFESCGDWIIGDSVLRYETAWGSPKIREYMIQGYEKCGFGVLRIPVAWSNMMGEDYTISPEYLARVKEVTEWALNSNLYVILNIHWDGGWWEKFPTEKEDCMYHYERVWTQLCEAFGGYGDHLMFESLNEEGCWNDVWNRWGGTEGKDEAYGLLNEINQKFVDIVRKSGGNNAKRHLLIAGYGTDVELTCDPLFKMPNDPENRMAVSVHYYTPSTFAILDKDADWGKAQTEWGSERDIEELNRNMDLMKTTYIDKGIPVIFGEFSCAAKANKTREMINLYMTKVCEAIYSRGMCPVIWDVENDFYYRAKAEWKDAELLKDLMAIKDKYK